MSRKWHANIGLGSKIDLQNSHSGPCGTGKGQSRNQNVGCIVPRNRLLMGISLCALSAVPVTTILLSAEDAQAQTVISGSQTTEQIVNGSATVQGGASVETGAATAIYINGANSTLTNLGTITNNNGISTTNNVNPTVFFLQ